MKILVDVSQLAYSGHGVGRYVRDLTDALLELPRTDQYVFFAGAKGNRKFFEDLSGVHPYSKAEWHISLIPPRLAHPLFNVMSMPIEWVAGPADVFHASDWTHPTSRIPTVTTVHDLVFRRYPNTVDPLVRRVQEMRLKRVVRSGSHIIADSMSTKNDLMKEYGIVSEKIDVVYPGVNKMFHKYTQKDIDAVRTAYNLPNKYILAVGTKEPRKNLDLAVDAYQQFASTSQGKNYHLVVTGRQGWGKQIGATKGVIETGYVNDADLPALYCGASALVYPSLYEGFGFPVLEAMACGTPVVTSSVSSLPEVAGDAGILVDPTDSSHIAEGIAQAIEYHAKLSTAGRAHAAAFTWERAARETREVYEKIYRH